MALLEDRDLTIETVEYLKTPPSFAQLDQLLQALNMQPRELMRRKESEYTELNLADDSLSREQLIQAMIDNPRLLERPIVVIGDKVAIGRPPENVLALLD